MGYIESSTPDLWALIIRGLFCPKLVARFGDSMTEEMSFETGLRELFALMLNGVHTAFPAIVQAFDVATLRAEIQPCLSRKYFDQAAATPLPAITDVPVLFPSSGNMSIVYPLDVGSYVLAVCSERALDMWLTSGGIVDPADSRKFEITDAIAIPGLFPLPSILVPPPVAGAIEIRNRAGTTMISISDTGVVFSGPVLFNDTVHACVVPNVPAAVVDLASHMHPTAAVGSPSVPTPIPGP